MPWRWLEWNRILRVTLVCVVVVFFCCCSGGLHVVAMALWMVLPLSLPVFTITGIWLVYVSQSLETFFLQTEPPVH